MTVHPGDAMWAEVAPLGNNNYQLTMVDISDLQRLGGGIKDTAVFATR